MNIFGLPVGKEKVKRDPTVHGTSDFPMGMYDTYFDDDFLGFVQWHWHEEIQFCMVTKGAFAFSVNDAEFTLREGQGLFINSGCIHTAKPIEVPGGIYICLNLNPKLLTFFPASRMDAQFVQPVIYSTNLRAIVFSGEKAWHREILDRLLVMHGLYAEREYGYEYDLCIEATLMWRTLARNVLSLAEPSGSGKMDFQKMKIILSYLHENYMEKIMLADIAGLVHLSVSECCRFFKRVTNSTIVEYLTDYRVKQSLDLLQFSDMSMSDIAYEVGFSSASYFVGRFRKSVGMPPTEYRKKMLSQRNSAQYGENFRVMLRQNAGLYSLGKNEDKREK